MSFQQTGGAKQSQQANMRQLGNTMKQRTQNRRQKQPQQQLKFDKNKINTSKTNSTSSQMVELNNSQSQEKLKRTRQFSQTEHPKSKQPVSNSSPISFDDIPLAMSASATPEPPFHQKRSSRNKNIVLLYNEDDKTSKEVSGHLGIALPVLAKYELTTDSLQKHREDRSGDSGYPPADGSEEDSEKAVAMITPRLLQEHDDNQNEVRNKGLHVVQWLEELNNPETETNPQQQQSSE